MTSQRPMHVDDLFHFNRVNFNRFTETFSTGFYAHYMCRWPDQSCVITDADGTIDGYMIGKTEGRGEEGHGHVSAVSVAPPYRHSGVASRLMKFTEDLGDKYNCNFIDLFVRPSNKGAVGMYNRLGYSVYKQILGYYGNDEDGYDMRKALKHDKEHKALLPTDYLLRVDKRKTQNVKTEWVLIDSHDVKDFPL